MTDPRTNRCLGQWNAWCARGETFEERNRRLGQVPETLREQVLAHLRTVHRLKKDAASKRRTAREWMKAPPR